jgi:hypothetical protein
MDQHFRDVRFVPKADIGSPEATGPPVTSAVAQIEQNPVTGHDGDFGLTQQLEGN